MSKDSKSSATTTILIVVMIALIILAIRMDWIPWNEANDSTFSPIYDTDSANDRFIKGELGPAQLKALDRILVQEQKNDEMRLSNEVARQIAKNDKAVIEAYGRWRKCYDLMRSRHHVVYPNQRKNLTDKN
ncbi:hypothetical protein JXO59_06275 [candidate division KSB1 bacterium]|nr:hypothetical protein [candidate division KSB1 bacterium]